MLLHCRTGQKYGLKRSDKKAVQNKPNFALFTSFDLFTEMDFLHERNGGIINPLFDGSTYNTSGLLAYCSYFSEPRRGEEK